MSGSTGAYIIEIDDEAVGIVVPDEDRAFRFFAAIKPYIGLEERRFATPRAAQKAARELVRGRRVAADR
ncbi:hypothetical protein [Blastochloris tepida]|jgi:hypothetical protein|uniref:Uncharacterized protein n=1 Tax=Blastochloris tepida TaxID=2233851 RepID=A0A348G101_9HYPH|nr:hypothetical protein [Blastochloris tepida]BBF93234.1 hypothetical protein BLTE_19190 [Blastochloris tepida]